MQGNKSYYRASLARGFATLCGALIVAAPSGALAAPTETVLYAFKGGSDGANPEAGLIADSNGNLYGTTAEGGASNVGTVFELMPPAVAGGAWTETVLHTFTGGSDGGNPKGSLIADSKGNLYGTTSGGTSNGGTVFELTPPAIAGGAWTETVLHAFTGGSDGGYPEAGLIADSKGNLYGTTAEGGASNAGAVFELMRPAIAGGAWSETVLHAFTGGSDGRFPLATLIADSEGNLYGTTAEGGASNAGTVFELMRPAIAGGAWSETVRHAFTGGSDGFFPEGSLIADSKGTLFGTTIDGGASNVGTIFLLTPPANAFEVWREAVLYAFTGGSNGGLPLAGLIADSNGNLYGTTNGGGASNAGTVFELTGTGLPLPPRICTPCRSPPICCACAGGTWTGKECI